jgi:hypothetical protein
MKKCNGKEGPVKRNVLAIALAVFMVVMLRPVSPIQAQTPDALESLELLQLVNQPTAGVLKKGQYAFELRTFGHGGLNAGIALGLFHRFSFGFSYGADGLIGYDDPTWNRFPGVTVKFRLIEESMVMPAVTLGFDMQGRGTWYDDNDRYLFKAPGFYGAVSRNFVGPVGNFGIHGGVNYNAVEAENESSVDFWVGADLAFNEMISLIGEFDFALDDLEETDPERFGEGYGYLNLGARLSLMQSLAIDILFLDIYSNSAENEGIGRELRLTYIETFAF